MAKSHLKLVTPTTEKRTVTPTRRPNAELRTREYLTEAEVERLIEAAKGNRGPPGRHHDPGGLPARPASERAGGPALGSGRLRQGHPARPQGQAGHTEHASDHRATNCGPCGELQREQEPKSPFVFTSERGSPFTTAGFARMVERAGAEAKLGFKAHPHMLRHACGFALANKGTIPGRCRPISATRTFSTRCATPSCRPIGSRISGVDWSKTCMSRSCRL